LVDGEDDDVFAATAAAEQGRELRPRPCPLRLCVGEFFADAAGQVRPVRHLDDRLVEAVDVADVVLAAGAEFAARGDAELVLEELLDFEFGA